MQIPTLPSIPLVVSTHVSLSAHRNQRVELSEGPLWSADMRAHLRERHVTQGTQVNMQLRAQPVRKRLTEHRGGALLCSAFLPISKHISEEGVGVGKHPTWESAVRLGRVGGWVGLWEVRWGPPLKSKCWEWFKVLTLVLFFPFF